MSRSQRVLKAVLLTFAVFTLGYAVGQEVGARRALASRTGALDAGGAAPAAGRPARQLVARYYHGTKRCVTCNTIEAQAREALATRFAAELADGRIVWETANMDDAWNADAVERYGLIRSSLVFVELRDGEEQDHSVLHRTWDLVADKARFSDYVGSAAEMVLEGWIDDDADGESPPWRRP